MARKNRNGKVFRRGDGRHCLKCDRVYEGGGACPHCGESVLVVPLAFWIPEAKAAREEVAIQREERKEPRRRMWPFRWGERVCVF